MPVSLIAISASEQAVAQGVRRHRTRDGGGKKTPPDRQLKEIKILDRYNNAAVVKIIASDWIDYLEVAKFNGDWKIIDVLWELKPKPSTQ